MQAKKIALRARQMFFYPIQSMGKADALLDAGVLLMNRGR